jgi:hypothetical protein
MSSAPGDGCTADVKAADHSVGRVSVGGIGGGGGTPSSPPLSFLFFLMLPPAALRACSLRAAVARSTVVILASGLDS